MSVLLRDFPSKKTIIRYIVTLTQEELEACKGVLCKGKHSSQQYRNARILVNTDEVPHGQKLSNEQIANAL